ncbi:OB-fold nucleic acid binding domain-containing protein [Tessaracoccus lapidicaptus]|uniref:OB-fold nucleic acid binding domain-containing protein n=1 Tax=Tessaracoccus lapidicaptus TaxID=1427523 RepID=UPI0033414B0E
MGKRPWGERLRRYFLSHEELEATELREQAEVAGAQPLAACPVRSRVTLRGTITSVTSDAAHGWLEAEVSDGSGTVRLVWMGRDHLECLLPGRTIRVEGRLADDRGQCVIYNPDFRIVPQSS